MFDGAFARLTGWLERLREWSAERRTFLSRLGVICLVAFVCRMIYIVQYGKSPFGAHLIIDSESYAQSAIQLLTGMKANFAEGPFWQAPGYIFFLYVMFGVFGIRNYFAVRVVQALLSTFLCVQAAHVARRIGLEDREALLAAALLALYWPLIFFTGELAIPVPYMFFMYGAFQLLLEAVHRRNTWLGLGGGIALGTAAVFRPNCLVLVPVMVWYAWRKTGALQRRYTLSAAFLVGVLAAVAPITIHNWRRGGEIVLISHNGGVNFYIGNNPRWKDTFNIRPGERWEVLVSTPSREVGPYRGLSPAKTSAYWISKVMDFARNQPRLFLKGLLEKTYLFFNRYELKRNVDLYFWSRYTPFLSSPFLVGFWLVGPFALLGICMGVFAEEEIRFVVYSSLIYSASIIAFFVCGRYRLAVVPLFCILASYAFFGLLELHRHGPRRTFMLACVFLAAAFAFVNSDLVKGIDKGEGEPLCYLADWSFAAGDLDKAFEYAQEALRKDPEFDGTYRFLARYYQMTGKPKKAVEAFRKYISKHPEVYLYYRFLGDLLLDAGEFDEAVEAYQHVLLEDPSDVRSLLGMARALRAEEKYDEALEWADKALRLKPGDKEALHVMGTICILRKKPDEAVYFLKQALETDPKFYPALKDLAFLYMEKKMYSQARELLERRPGTSAQEEALRRYAIGLCCLELGLMDEARHWVRYAMELGYKPSARVMERLFPRRR